MNVQKKRPVIFGASGMVKGDQYKAIRGKTLNRRLLFNLVDIVWGDVNEDQSVPSTDHAKSLIIKAIERTRKQKYESQKD